MQGPDEIQLATRGLGRHAPEITARIALSLCAPLASIEAMHSSPAYAGRSAYFLAHYLFHPMFHRAERNTNQRNLRQQNTTPRVGRGGTRLEYDYN